MKLIAIFILLLLLVFLGIFLYTWYRLHTSFNLHVSAKNINPSDFSLPYELHYLTTSDHIKIASWYIPVKNPKAAVILVHRYDTAFGGKALMLPHAKYLSEAGYSTLLIDLRSFGQSEGHKVTLGVNEWKDVDAAYDYVRSLPENKNKKIGYLGQSMGAVTSLVTAGITGKGDFVIASVPFASFKSLFDYQIHNEGLPVHIFLPVIRLAALLELGAGYENYTPSSQVGHIHVPILFIEANKDQEVNKNDTEYLFNHANNPKELWKADAPHDIYESNPDEFKNRVLDFISKNI